MPTTAVANPTIAVAAVTPTVPSAATIGSVAFERASYTLTVTAGNTIEVPFFLRIASGFTDPVQLRVNNLPPTVLVRFDPNPARNFFTMTLRTEMAAPPASSFDIEAVSATSPGAVLARTTVLLFVNGTTAIAGPIGVSTGNPLAPPGIAYSVSPATVEVTRGVGAGTVRIDLSRQGNYSGPVTFTITSALPASVGTSFQTNSTAGNENFLFVSAGSAAVAGTYVVTLEIATTTQRLSASVTVVVK